jgi:hypothetical protein
MANTSAYYLACAEQSLRDAEASTLVNVRERHLHSAAAWQAMAARAAKVEASRIAREDGIAIPPCKWAQGHEHAHGLPPRDERANFVFLLWAKTAGMRIGSGAQETEHG